MGLRGVPGHVERIRGDRLLLRMLGRQTEHHQRVPISRQKHGRPPGIAVLVGVLHERHHSAGHPGRDVRLWGTLRNGVDGLRDHDTPVGVRVPAGVL